MNKRLNQATRARRAGQRGFTLIELLVVIAVLAVLAAVVIFNVTGVKNSGGASACATDVKSVQTAVDAAINDGSAITAADLAGTGWNTVLVPRYLHTIPTSCANGFVLGAGNTVTGS
ncbi:MAG TPA: prepilin-type N-terminal cleavage/methylation domain-containing protein [Candidatus Dormibacteraeota bacterium]|jgi:general secretion pathway protein G